MIEIKAEDLPPEVREALEEVLAPMLKDPEAITKRRKAETRTLAAQLAGIKEALQTYNNLDDMSSGMLEDLTLIYNGCAGIVATYNALLHATKREQ